MTTLAALKKQIASLESEANRLLNAEKAAAIAQARELIAAFGLGARDLGLAVGRTGGQRRAKRAGAGEARYVDPKTGKTWSGFGRVPAWIANARNRDVFLADRGTEAAAPAAPAKASGKAAKVAKAPRAAKAAVAAAKPTAKPAKPVETPVDKPAKPRVTRKAPRAAPPVAVEPVVESAAAPIESAAPVAE